MEQRNIYYKDNFYEPFDIRIILNNERYIERYRCAEISIQQSGDCRVADEEKEAYYGCSSYDTTIDYVEKVLYKAEWDNIGFCLMRKNTTVVKAIAETEGHLLSPRDMVCSIADDPDRYAQDFCKLIGREHEWDFTDDEKERISKINQANYEIIRKRLLERCLMRSIKKPNEECRAYIHPLPQILKPYNMCHFPLFDQFENRNYWRKNEETQQLLIAKYMNGIPIE